jgi:hypothetical protein
MPSPYGVKSNKARYTYDGWDAEMTWVLAAADVAAFIASNYLDEYAASTNMAVVEILDEPYMDKDVVDDQGYSNSRKITARFKIVYLDVPWPTDITRPDYADGTTLKLHTDFGGHMQPLPPGAIAPPDGPLPSPNTRQHIYEVLNTYHVEWGRVTDLDSLDFSDYLGEVNSDDFMGVPAGQMLCAGASHRPTTVLTPGEPLAWTVVLTFKQKSITTSDGTFGWNDWYNPATEQYEAMVLSSGDPPYDDTAFGGIFS